MTLQPILDREVERATNRQNLLLLVQLRWLAMGGQVATIVIIHFGMGIPLPLGAMGAVLGLLLAWNLVTLARYRSGAAISNAELFLSLHVDVAALTAELYLSGGASNPFVSLFLLQVILAAVLLELRPAMALAAVAAAAFVGLVFFNRPLAMPAGEHEAFLSLHVLGMFLCFLLTAGLLLIFLTRINANLAARDRRLADLRQQAAEEDHIVRMGLLAAGAAHELGTPMATLSVILNDWRRLPFFRRNAEARAELAVMEAELERCKRIVSGILLSSGEPRGEGAFRIAARQFVQDVADSWRASRAPADFSVDNSLPGDMEIVSDIALTQVLTNLLDNALEASPGHVRFAARREAGEIVLEVADSGPGFAPAVLPALGKPYVSTKAKPGSGLGLFLVFNVMRKLGGTITAANRPQGGAIVTLRLPRSGLTPGQTP